MLRALHRDIHCKNVRWSNGISAPCSGADDGADESTSPQVGIRHVDRTGDAHRSDILETHCGKGGSYFDPTETVILMSELPRIPFNMPDTWIVKESCP